MIYISSVESNKDGLIAGGDGSEGVSRFDASRSVRSAQDMAELLFNLTRPIAAYAAKSLIRILQNAS